MPRWSRWVGDGVMGMRIGEKPLDGTEPSQSYQARIRMTPPIPIIISRSLLMNMKYGASGSCECRYWS